MARKQEKARRPVGRPPAAGERRACELSVRVTAGELGELRERATAAGLGVSEFVRRLLLGRRSK